MSILSDKYKVSEPVIKNMIQDGLISSTWQRYEQVAELRRNGQSIEDIAFNTNMSKRNVLYVLKKIDATRKLHERRK